MIKMLHPFLPASDILNADSYLKGLSSKYPLLIQEKSVATAGEMQALYLHARNTSLNMNDNRRKLPEKLSVILEKIREMGAGSEDMTLNILPYMLCAGMVTHSANPVNRKMFHQYIEPLFEQGIELADRLKESEPESFNRFFYSAQLTLFESLLDIDSKLDFPEQRQRLVEKSGDLLKKPFLNKRYLNSFLPVININHSPNRKYGIDKKSPKIAERKYTAPLNMSPDIELKDVIKDCYWVVEESTRNSFTTLSGFNEIWQAKKMEERFKEYMRQTWNDALSSQPTESIVHKNVIYSLTDRAKRSDSKKIKDLACGFILNVKDTIELDEQENMITADKEVLLLVKESIDLLNNPEQHDYKFSRIQPAV